MEGLSNFLSSIGQEVEDADEESFLLFSRDIPSSNLGFVDSKAATLDITIHNQDYAIHQSPSLLSSSRAGGTTGAVLWKITPLFAEWISNTSNSLWTNSILTPSSTVVELGCGISGLTALALSHLIGHYLATDQEYVLRLFRQNLDSNPPQSQRQQAPSKSKGRKQQQQQQQKSRSSKSTPTEQMNGHPHPNITFTSLDWELDNPATLRQQIPTTTSTATQERGEDDEEPAGSDKGFDVLLSCDCIYNESLIAPFVRTCAEICNLRPGARPTVCIIAQQQRSPDVFEAWLRETMRWFRVWRVGADALGGKLGGGSGYLVHMLVLKG